MATSKISASEGTGKNLATHSFSEDAMTKELQRVVMSNSSGAEITSQSITVGGTTFTNSAGNSSTAQLTAGSTFTGTIENVLTGKGLLVAVYCGNSQPFTVNVLQYIDVAGTQLVGTSTFTRLAGASLNETVQLNGNYAKITVTNNGASTTTGLVIDTWFGDMPPFPVSLTNSGNFRVELPPKQTFKASTIIPLVTAITANVPFFNIIGSATKTVTVKKISINGHTLTAVAYTTINVEKLNTASSGGTSTTLVATPLDSNNTATAVVKAYTVAPTKGNLVGTVSSQRVLSQATTAAAAGIPCDFEFKFADINDSSGLVLRGVTQEICLTYPVALATAGTCAIDIEWTED